ncbi:MAG: hypothetical protein ACKO01_13820 [Erythrobacter sp.]
MEDRILADAQNLKKLIREAEALADEAIIAMARLKQAMLTARQNPAVEVNTGQRALLRLTEAESQALAMSTNLLRVHDELSKVARVHAGGDMGNPTTIPPADIEAVAVQKEPAEA